MSTPQLRRQSSSALLGHDRLPWALGILLTLVAAPALAGHSSLNPANGNHYRSETVIPAAADGLGLTFAYNSLLGSSGTVQPFGQKWRSSYHRRLSVSPSDATKVVVARPDGKSYILTGSGGTWTADADVVDTLTELKDTGGTRIGWRYLKKSSLVTEDYDAAGLLLKLTRADTRTLSFAYSDGAGGILYGTTPSPSGYQAPACTGIAGATAPSVSGRLLCVVDTFGRQLNFAYDSAGRVTQATDPAGNPLQFAHDTTNNNLTGITFADNTSVGYTYNESQHINNGGGCTEAPNGLPNALTGYTDEAGIRQGTFKYDCQGRGTYSEAALGTSPEQLNFDTASTTVIDAYNTGYVHNYTEVLGVMKPTGVSQPGGAGCLAAASSVAYDANGNATAISDFNGHKTCRAFDLATNLLQKQVEGLLDTDDCAAALASPPTTGTVRTTNYQWDSATRKPVAIAGPQLITTYTYNTAGRPLTRTLQATTDATGAAGLAAQTSGTPRTWAWTYNSYGNVLTADGPLSGTDDQRTFTYYPVDAANLGARGQLATASNTLAHTSQVTSYDASGRPLTLVDPNGSVTTLTYDPRGRVLTATTGNETTTYTLNSTGKPTRITRPDGSYLDYGYDDAQRLTSLQDSLGNRIEYTLNPAGARITESVKDTSGTLVQRSTNEYDALGRLQRVVGE